MVAEPAATGYASTSTSYAVPLTVMVYFFMDVNPP